MSSNIQTTLKTEDSWGIASLRQCSGFPGKNLSYHAPLANSVVTWDIKTKDRTIFQAHTDLVTVMRQNEDTLILTCSYKGEVKIWDNEYRMKSSFELPSTYVVDGAWSDDGSSFGICTKGPKQMLIIYDLKEVLHGQKKCKWFYSAPQEPGKELGDKKGSNGNHSGFDCFNACIFKKDLDVLALYQSTKKCKIFSFSKSGEFLKSTDVSPLQEEENVMLCTSRISKGIFAVGLRNGVFGFYNAETLEMESVIQATGSPQVCLWKGEELVTTSYLSGVISWWNRNGEFLREVKGAPAGSIVHMDLCAQSSRSYWIGGIMSLHYVTLAEDLSHIAESKDMSLLNLTGCGISVSNQGIVAAGDFTGSVMLFKDENVHPYHTTKIDSQIRCLLWFKSSLLIGLLDGELLSWNNAAGNDNDVPFSLYHFVGGVVAMKLSNDGMRLAVGTTRGYLFVFEINMSEKKTELDLVYKSLEHKPQISPDGTEVPMEIWSLVWSPDDAFIVTTSEDKLSVVADSKTGNIHQILTGHTTAVTSSGWKILSDRITNLLITCADDKTARIYNGISFELLRIVNTYDIYGWHTLTYLCIDNTKDRLICSTQNGYLSIWNLKTYEVVYQEKLHGGSIEGMVLDCEQKFIYTVGSDCVVNRFTFVS